MGKPVTQVELDQYEMLGDDGDADIRELKMFWCQYITGHNHISCNEYIKDLQQRGAMEGEYLQINNEFLLSWTISITCFKDACYSAIGQHRPLILTNQFIDQAVDFCKIKLVWRDLGAPCGGNLPVWACSHDNLHWWLRSGLFYPTAPDSAWQLGSNICLQKFVGLQVWQRSGTAARKTRTLLLGNERMQEFRERQRGMVRQGEGKVVNNSQRAFGRMVNPLSHSRLTTWTSLSPLLPQQDGRSRASRSVWVVPFCYVLIWLWRAFKPLSQLITHEMSH